MNGAPAVAALLALTAAAPLPAQTLMLRLGGFRATYADSLSGSAAAAGADFRWSSARAGVAVSGTASSFSDGGWAGQGSLTAERYVGDAPDPQVALTAALDASTFTGGAWVGIGTAGISGSLDAGPVVAGASLGAGGVRNLDGRETLLLEAAGRLAHGFGGWSAEGWGGGTAAGGIRFGDAGAGIRWERGAFALDLRAGYRFGDLGNIGWAQARASVRVAGGVWLEASGGRYPPDVTGFLHGTFAQATVRLALGRGSRERAGPAIRRVRGDGITVRFAVADTGAVSVAGEWNEWRVEPLEADGPHAWLLRASLAPGVYRFALVRADGTWMVPAGSAAVSDDFGGSVGLLVVPR